MSTNVDLLSKNRAQTARINAAIAARGDVGPSYRALVAQDEYGRELAVRMTSCAPYAWTLTVRTTTGSTYVETYATEDDARRAGESRCGRIMSGWTRIRVST